MSQGVRIAYTLSVVPPNTVTGVAIAFASKPIYIYYTTVPRLGGMTVVQDQMLGGVIMWIPGSMMYLIAALILITQAMRAENTGNAFGGKLAPAFEEHDGNTIEA
jgi:putative membrane protein